MSDPPRDDDWWNTIEISGAPSPEAEAALRRKLGAQMMAWRAMVAELERMQRDGLTDSEVDRILAPKGKVT